MAERSQMAKSKNKESVLRIVQPTPDVPANDGASQMQTAAEALIKIIIQAGDSVRRAG
jgi:hypothetical protein